MWTATPIYEVEVEGENTIVFGLMEPSVSADPSDEVLEIPRAGVNRMDLVAYKSYGIADLWHVLANVNNSMDPLVDFSLREKIRVPKKTRLAQLGLLNV